MYGLCIVTGSLTETIWFSHVRRQFARQWEISYLRYFELLFYGFLAVFLGKLCQNFSKICECFYAHGWLAYFMVFYTIYSRYATEILSNFG